MLKTSPLLNGRLTAVLTTLRHGEKVVIADAGLPAPEGVERLDLAVARDVPSLADVLPPLRDATVGLYPRKGVIAPGSDADLALWDPEARRTITIDGLHHEGDYRPWEGWEVEGWPVMTILRGRVVVEDGELRAVPGDGRFVKRALAADVRERPVT